MITFQKIIRFHDPREKEWFDSLVMAIFTVICGIWLGYAIHLAHSSPVWGWLNILWAISALLFWPMFAWSALPDEGLKKSINNLWQEYIISIEAAFNTIWWALLAACIGLVSIVGLFYWITLNVDTYSLSEKCLAVLLGLLIFLFATVFTSAGIISGRQQWEQRNSSRKRPRRSY